MNVLRSFGQEVARAASAPRPAAESGLIVEKVRMSAAHNIAPDDLPAVETAEFLEATIQ